MTLASFLVLFPGKRAKAFTLGEARIFFTTELRIIFYLYGLLTKQPAVYSILQTQKVTMSDKYE